MNVRYPANSAVLSEARIYAQESYRHTMDYEGWQDQHMKLKRLTYGKYGQLWVAEFCRLNRIKHKKDTSGPTVADDMDLSICGMTFDIKTSIDSRFLGQVSPGSIRQPVDYYGLVLTDINCNFIEPRGFIRKRDYVESAIKVEQGQCIPGTNTANRFSASYFPGPETVITPFVQFLLKLKATSEATA